MASDLEKALRRLLGFRLVEWVGLPPCIVSDIDRIFGPASTVCDRDVGTYPALCGSYSVPTSAATGLIVYSRAHRVVAIETAEAPPVTAMDSLGQPDICKPPELSLPGYLVREHLYCHRGLVLSVAKSLDSTTNQVKIARCRGIRVLANPQEYGAEFYLALQDRMVFK